MRLIPTLSTIRLTSPLRLATHNITNSSFYILLSLLILSILLTASSCNKEQPDPPPDLPPLTNVGAMTFGCYVNGEPWVAEVPPFQAEFRHIAASLNKLSNSIIIYGRKLINEPNVNQEIYLKVTFSDLVSLPNTELNFIYLDQSFIDNKNLSYKHELDTLYDNSFILSHLDLDKRIISGQFEMRAISTTTNDTIVIKDGRFDTIFSVIE